MDVFEKVLSSPGTYIIAAVVLVFLAMEIYKIVKWFKDRLEEYRAKKNKREELDNEVCHMACLSQEHTKILDNVGKSLDNINVELKDIRIDIKDLKESQAEHIRKEKEENLQDKADAARSRILRFADELRIGVNHSEEMYNQILDDISFYQSYCRNHENYPNQKALSAIALISDDYEDRLKNNDFLTAPKEEIKIDESKRSTKEIQNKKIKENNV